MTATVTTRKSIVVALFSLAVLASCRPVTEIVLVIDTDMNVPADLDRVTITVEGSTPTTLRVDLVAQSPGQGQGQGEATGSRFPLTLGLLRAGSTSAVTITAAASSQTSPVLSQTIKTTFVEGEIRMLRMVLSIACLPVTCGAEETCDAGSCQPTNRAGASLPEWVGVVPARPEPPLVLPIVGRSVWASGWHSAAVEGTTLYAWGENSNGQLGTGNTQNAKTRRPVMRIQGPLSVGLGQKHSCVCDRSRQAFCWGLNTDGQLGTANFTSQVVPTPVPDFTDCAQIAGAGGHSCAIRMDGTVACWGLNAHGQVGRAAGLPVTVPSPVAGLTEVIQIGGGDRHTCALRTDKSVWCWGDNGFGQLGDRTTTSRAVPAAVPRLTDVVEIAVGRGHVCARHSAGTLSCWGNNDDGQLGDGTQNNSSFPVAVMGLADATQVVSGHQHVCALLGTTKRMVCWGANDEGQLGLGMSGPMADTNVPGDPVLNLFDVSSIAAGSAHNCARHANRAALSCWGDNFVNQLGDGSTMDRAEPVSVAGF